jgi:hypothetical protein
VQRPEGQHDDLARLPRTQSRQGSHRRSATSRDGSCPSLRHASRVVAAASGARTSRAVARDSSPVSADNERGIDHENKKTPISKPAANDQRPNVQPEITRTRLRRSWSCGISWDRSVIAARPSAVATSPLRENWQSFVTPLASSSLVPKRRQQSLSCGRGSIRRSDFPHSSSGFEPGLCRPRAPPPGNGISRPETKAPKRPPKSNCSFAETKRRQHAPPIRGRSPFAGKSL